MKTSKLYINYFIFVSGVCLVLSAVAKLISISGEAGILRELDPVFGISFKHLLLLAGLIECAVAAICLFSNRVWVQSILLAWLASCFLLYRFGMLWVGYHKLCPCLGNVTDALHVSPQMSDMAMKIILVYLLIGSYATLFWLWRQHGKAEARMQNEEIKPATKCEIGAGV